MIKIAWQNRHLYCIKIAIDFRGRKKIAIMVLGAYRLANTFSGKYGSRQNIQKDKGCLTRSSFAALNRKLDRWDTFFLTVGFRFQNFHHELIVPNNTTRTKGDGRDRHLQHSLVRSGVRWAGATRSQLISVVWKKSLFRCYRSAKTLACKCGWRQTIWPWRRNTINNYTAFFSEL